MKTIRIGTFETNSSSTHSLTMCMKEEYKKWKEGELFFIPAGNKFVTKEERNAIIRKEMLEGETEIDWNNNTITFRDKTASFEGGKNEWEDMLDKRKSLITQEDLDAITDEQIEEWLEDNFDTYETPCTYDQFFDNEYLEVYEQEYKTLNGDEIVAFGTYGNDY